jgi:hypothetical protein
MLKNLIIDNKNYKLSDKLIEIKINKNYILK